MRELIKNSLVVIEKISKGKIDARLLKVRINSFLRKTKFEQIIFLIIDLIFCPLVLISSLILKFIRLMGIRFLYVSKWIFDNIGIYPIIDHYYEPLFKKKYIRKPLSSDRVLKAIDFNLKEQLMLIKQFTYNEELLMFPVIKKNPLEFAYDEGSFPRGDSEYYYSIIRHFKPKRIIEIGSGQSTLMAYNAIKKNSEENMLYNCKLICVEPFEQKWLEKIENIFIIRKKVENVEPIVFKELVENDILFIDSSHMIRPQGDVLFEIFSILPSLNKGVFVHFHDIFTPKDYPEEWVVNNKLFWNEQYLLEAFLSYNKEFKIIGALNFLANNYSQDFLEKCPLLKEKLKGKSADYALGSIWLKKI